MAIIIAALKDVLEIPCFTWHAVTTVLKRITKFFLKSNFVCNKVYYTEPAAVGKPRYIILYCE